MLTMRPTDIKLYQSGALTPILDPLYFSSRFEILFLSHHEGNAESKVHSIADLEFLFVAK